MEIHGAGDPQVDFQARRRHLQRADPQGERLAPGRRGRYTRPRSPRRRRLHQEHTAGSWAERSVHLWVWSGLILCASDEGPKTFRFEEKNQNWGRGVS